MPQNKPMTPEALSNALRECADGSDEQNTYELDDDQALAAIESRDAQLIRSTLEAAADQFCKICPGPGCPGQCKVSDKSECGYWQNIAQKGEI